MNYEDRKVTMYAPSEFYGNIVKRETRLSSIEEHQKYAQYRNAIKIVHKPKGKRKYWRKTITSHPYIVIVDGWDNPDPKEMYDIVEQNDGDVIVKTSSYAAFDSGFVTDFDKVLESLKDKIIFQAKASDGYSCY